MISKQILLHIGLIIVYLFIAAIMATVTQNTFKSDSIMSRVSSLLWPIYIPIIILVGSLVILFRKVRK